MLHVRSYTIEMFHHVHIVDLWRWKLTIWSCSLPIAFLLFVMISWTNIRWSCILNLSPNSFLFCWNSPFPKYQPSTCVSIRHNTIYTWRIHLYTSMSFKIVSMWICADEYRQMIKILLCPYWHASYNTLFIPVTDTRYCRVPYLYWLEMDSMFRPVCTLY